MIRVMVFALSFGLPAWAWGGKAPSKAQPKAKVALNFLAIATWKQAQAQAKKQKKPLLLMIYSKTNWASKQMQSRTLKATSLQSLLSRYVRVRFEVSSAEGKKLLKRYRSHYLPTIISFDAKGLERDRSIMYSPARYFRPVLQAGLGQVRSFAALAAHVKARPKDMGATLELAHRSYIRRKRRLAHEMYKRLLKLDPTHAKGFGAWGRFGVARCLVRRARYTQARDMLVALLKQKTTQGEARREAHRLLLKVYKWFDDTAQIKRWTALFKKRYPRLSPDFD